MNNVKVLVDLPSGIYKQKRSNGTAVYQYTKHFRNKEGKSRHKSIMIGMLDKESGRLIPNDNYYIHNNIQFPNIAFQSVQDYGYTYSFYSLSDKIGLTYKCQYNYVQKGMKTIFWTFS